MSAYLLQTLWRKQVEKKQLAAKFTAFNVTRSGLENVRSLRNQL